MVARYVNQTSFVNRDCCWRLEAHLVLACVGAPQPLASPREDLEAIAPAVANVNAVVAIATDAHRALQFPRRRRQGVFVAVCVVHGPIAGDVMAKLPGAVEHLQSVIVPVADSETSVAENDYASGILELAWADATATDLEQPPPR